MKQLRNIILSTVSAGLVLSLVGCTNDYEDYNQDPYGVTKKETERDAYSLGAAMVNLQSWVVPTDVNTNQFTECCVVVRMVVTSLIPMLVLLVRTLLNIVQRMVGVVCCLETSLLSSFPISMKL